MSQDSRPSFPSDVPGSPASPGSADSVDRLLMEANLREFAREITTICALEAGQKLSPHEAYAQIRRNWQKLKTARKALLHAGQTG